MPEESYSFFGWSLKEGSIFAGHFTSVISMISCALAFAVFFREADAENTNSKLFSFLVACYSVFYIAMSRSLIRGVKDNRRDKFVCWIIMSVITVVMLLSGLFYVIVLLATGQLLAKHSIFMTFTILGTSVLSILLIVLLVYCIRGVVTLWRLYGGGNTEGETV